MNKKSTQRGPGRPPATDSARLMQVTVRLNASQRVTLARVGVARLRSWLDSLAAN